MFLAKMNYLEVEEYLKKSDTIVIPVGSLENHGKHMPLGTDTMIPDKIAELLDEKSDLLIAPTINYGATDDLV
ncbi:MAG: creatininase family protein, partial [Lachnospiraceae bacterium]|nr:creatininase family protein [Lachnospiraceae bacterium]